MSYIKSPKRRTQRGQGLAEYALIIVLVAILVIGVASALGFGIQRVYGLVAGALGAHYDTHKQHTIVINSAQCISLASVNQTGLWVIGSTDENLGDVTGSSEFGGSPVSANGAGFNYHPMIDANHADVTECPASVVI